MSEQQPQRIVLVDTNAFLHSSWHGYPERLGPDGRCSRVAYGTLKKIERLHRDFEWDVLVNVLDPEGGSLYRKGLFPGYKANRPEPEPDFTRQKMEIPEHLDKLGLNPLKIEGVESDDVIGSIARQETARGNLVMVVSPDKDLSQLVDEMTYLLRPVKTPAGESTFECYQAEDVFKRFGVYPQQIPDWLALLGDAVDNIPGVDKVGEKTATKWLQQHGSIEALIEAAESIKGVVGENLRASVDLLGTVKKLTTIQRDLEIDRASYARAHAPVEQQVLDVQKRLGFPHWLGRFPGLLAQEPAPAQGRGRAPGM